VKALGEKDFEVDSITVDEDGKILLPYVNEPIIAKCLTERELQTEVAKRWSKFLKNPQLFLKVTQRNSRPPVSIYGEVRQQQQVTLTRRAYLLELISFAGGVTEKSGGMVQVFRTRPPMCEDPKASNELAGVSNGLDVPSQLYSLASLRQGREEANPEIFPGDIIVVQRAAPVYITGEVVRPGEYSIPEGGLPLTQAVAMASGITRDAKTKTITVYRRRPGSSKPDVIVANYDQIKKGQEKDLTLEPLDIVEVDKSKMGIGDFLMKVVTGLPNRIPIPIRPL
jgi:polysaccharide export outer membrane protein